MHPVTFALALMLITASFAQPGPSPSRPSSAEAQPKKQVLILFDERMDLPGLRLLDQGVTAGLRSSFGSGVEIYRESLDLSRFPMTNSGEFLRDHYRQKYSGKRIDIVLAMMKPSLDFILRYGKDIFPDVPVVFCNVEKRQMIERAPGSNFTGVIVKRDFAKTASLVLKVLPGTKQFVFVSGTSDYDRGLAELARADLKQFEGRIRISYLTDLPLDELLGQVAKLPSDSVVLVSSLFVDGRGAAWDPYEVVSLISQRANVPTFGFTDQYVGRGIVGGHVFTLESEGEKAAELITRILHGEKAGDVPFIEMGPSADTFDWRQLRRWKIDQTILPPRSVLRFYQPSLWERRKGLLIGIATLVTAESLIIISMILNLRRRRRAEKEARLRREQVNLLTRVSLLGEMTASLAHELNQPLSAMVSNANAGIRMIDRGTIDSSGIREIFTDMAADGHRAYQIIQNIRATIKKGGTVQKPIKLNKVIRTVVHMMHPETTACSCKLETFLEKNLPKIQGDPTQIQQVFINLVSNALDAMRETPAGKRRIEITTQFNGSGVVTVGVRDYGRGIAKDARDRLFEQFFTTKNEGLGLGLFIVRSIIETHGGKISSENADGGGARFYFTLPISKG